MSSWLSAFEGVVAATIPVVGLVYTYTTNKRSQYERVLALTEQASTPPIADDRHGVGTALEWADSEGRPIDATQVTPFLRHLASEHARLRARRSRHDGGAD